MRAAGLWRALSGRGGARRGRRARARRRRRGSRGGARRAGDPAEYLAIVDPATLAEVAVIERPVMIALAARIGKARLIDNIVANPPT